MKRSPLPPRRIPLARVGRRGRQRARTMNRLRGQVFDRDRYRCVAVISPRCTGRAEHAHHVWPVGNGGPDDLSNLISVCFHCHRWIHDTPREAELLGLLQHRG